MSRSRLILASTCIAFAIGTGASEPALAGPLHFYNSSGVKLSEGTSLLVNITGGTQTLKDVAGGLPIEADCTALDSIGKVENPTGGSAGITLASLLYLGCVIAPASLECKIPQGMLSFSVNGVLEGTNSSPDIQFSPDPSSGTIFAKIVFEKCKNAGLNTEYPVEGSALAKVNNATSSVKIEEVKGSASMLRFAGNEAGLVGTETVEMTGGGKLEVKE